MKKWVLYVVLGATLASFAVFIVAVVDYEGYVSLVLPVRDNSWVYFEYLVNQEIWVPNLCGVVTIIMANNGIWCWYAVKRSAGENV